MGKGHKTETGRQCNPNAFADEDVVAAVKAAAAGGEPASWHLTQAACRWAQLQQRNVWLCFYQTQPLPNLWQPKDQYLLICTGSENRKEPLEHRALTQMEISSRIHKISSYFSKVRAFYPYAI